MFQHLVIQGHTYKGPSANSLPRKVLTIGTKRELDLEGIDMGPMVAYSNMIFEPKLGGYREAVSVRYEELNVFARWCKQDVTNVLRVVSVNVR